VRRVGPSGVPFERQVERDVIYKGHRIRGQRLDLLIAGEVIIELKSVSDLPEVAMAQVLSYLKATGLKRSLLINFGAKRLTEGIKRISL
jgi:GxxExxY protein